MVKLGNAQNNPEDIKKPSLSIKKNDGSKLNLNSKSDLSNVMKKNDKLKEQEKQLKEIRGQNEAIIVDYSDEDEEKHEKMKRNLAIKKWLIIGSATFFFIGVSTAALYHVFTYKPYTQQEVAYMANLGNGKTNFPMDGLSNFLNKNIQKLMEPGLEFSDPDPNASYNLSNVRIDITKPQTDSLTNVYYYVDLNTNGKVTTLYSWIPVKYNFKKGQYQAAGEPVLVSTKPYSSNSNVGTNPMLKFNESSMIDSEKLNSQQTFVDNFFKLFYGGQDISPLYKGTVKLQRDTNVSYDSMNDFKMYTSKNKAGYNAEVNVTLKLPNDMTYNTKKYLDIEKADKTFTINAMQ